MPTRTTSGAEDMDEPLTSIVIPVVPGGEMLGQCLDRIARQNYQKTEVIVVCDARAADLPSLPEGSENLRVIRERHSRSAGRLINSGLRAARGQFKILLRPHCIPVDTDWIRKVLRPFDDENVGAVVSQCQPVGCPEAGLGSRLLDAMDSPLRRNEEGHPVPQSTVSGLCDAYRASLLADVGYVEERGMPEPATPRELSLKLADAGYSMLLSDSAAVTYHTPAGRDRLTQALMQGLDYGHADAVLGKLYDANWLNAGVHGAAFFSLFLLPAALLHLPTAIIASAALFVWSVFLSVQTPLLRWEWPLAVLNMGAFVALVLLIRDDWAPGLFGRRVHPAILRQWCWLAAITGSNLLLVVVAAARAGLRALRRPKGWLYAGPVFLLGLLWWLLAGVGFLRGTFFGGARGE